MSALDAARSLLYVPAHNEKMVLGASKRGADALILDLEDSVPVAEKSRARERLEASVRAAGEHGAAVLVRVNASWTAAWREIEVAVGAGADGVVLPKVGTASTVQVVGEYLRELETHYRRAPVALLVIVESAKGLLSVADIAEALARAGDLTVADPEPTVPTATRASDEGTASERWSTALNQRRLTALVPGNEDLALSLQVESTPELMGGAVWPLVTAARANGHRIYGSIGSGADYRDLTAYRQHVLRAKGHGFDGVTCIHPAQVDVINTAYDLATFDVAWARRAVAAFEAGGAQAIGVDGKMVDEPVYRRLKALLERHPA